MFRKNTLRKKRGGQAEQMISTLDCNRQRADMFWEQLAPLLLSINPNIKSQLDIYYQRYPRKREQIETELTNYTDNLSLTATTRDIYHSLQDIFSRITNNVVKWPDLKFSANGELDLGITNPSAVQSIVGGTRKTLRKKKNGGAEDEQITRGECTKRQMKIVLDQLMNVIINSSPTIQNELNTYYQTHPTQYQQIQTATDNYLSHLNRYTREIDMYNHIKNIYSQLTNNSIKLPNLQFNEDGKVKLSVLNPSAIQSFVHLPLSLSNDFTTVLYGLVGWKLFTLVIKNNLFHNLYNNRSNYYKFLNNHSQQIEDFRIETIEDGIINQPGTLNNKANLVITTTLNWLKQNSNEQEIEEIPLGVLRNSVPDMSTTPDFLTGAIMNPNEMIIFGNQVFEVLKNKPPPPNDQYAENMVNEFIDYFQTNQDKFTQFVEYLNNLIKTATSSTNPTTFFDSIINWLTTNTTITSVSIFTNQSPASSASSGGRRKKSRKYRR